MSYTKPCVKCGQRISLRQMPHGQWVAFDVLTEETHVCGIKNKPSISVKLKDKKTKKNKSDESDLVDIGYDEADDHEEENDDKILSENSIEEDKGRINKNKIYDNVSGIHHCIDNAIKEKKRIFIRYYSNHNAKNTSREISPIKKYKLKGTNYLQAYCHKRESERNFLTKSILSAQLLDKDRTKNKLGKPKTEFIEKMKDENNPFFEKKNNFEKIEKKNKPEYIKTSNNIVEKDKGSPSAVFMIVIFWVIVAAVINLFLK